MKGYLQTKTIFPPAIFRKPSLNLGLIVVIPACREPFLLLSLLSLKKCNLPQCDVEVIVVINDAENASESTKTENKATFQNTLQWAAKNSTPRLKFHVLYFNELPAKKAGVGLARKIGMDEACWRFEKAKSKNGIIVSLDADCKCDINYFQAIEQHFTDYPDKAATSIHFEYPLSGPDFSEKQYRAITSYELHLRYCQEAKRWTGFPHAFHSRGSSFAVRWEDYIKHGGMNTMLEEEDFYFLQKFIRIDKMSEINETRVFLSPRISDRKPSGTGKAMQEILKSKQAFKTYHPDGFKILKSFFKKILDNAESGAITFENLHPALQSFLEKESFLKEIGELSHQTKNRSSFEKRFFQWFNSVQIEKFLKHHRQYQPDIEILRAALWLIDQYEDMLQAPTDQKGALKWFRARQRSGAMKSSKMLS